MQANCKINGIKLARNRVIRTVLYANGQRVLSKSEEMFQIATNQLNKIACKYNMGICISKAKVMALCGMNFQRVKM
jgi:hypothetical protein